MVSYSRINEGVEVGSLAFLLRSASGYALKGDEPCSAHPGLRNCSQMTHLFSRFVYKGFWLGCFCQWGGIGEHDTQTFSFSRAHSLTEKEILSQSFQQ